jgi:putative hydrolase of the HAD superfamily
LNGIRAVAFDAVGTLITPEPPVAEAYRIVGRRYGSRLDVGTIRSRFRASFRAEEERDRASGWRTDPARERARWRGIVATVLDDTADQPACFRELWDHFSRPSSWRCLPGVGPVLTQLSQCGLALGLASNFDSRLHGVAAGLSELAVIRPVVVSAEVGWRKPAKEFFVAAVRAIGCPPKELLVVGDNYESDYVGAMAAGLRAVLIGAPKVGVTQVTALAELLAR